MSSPRPRPRMQTVQEVASIRDDIRSIGSEVKRELTQQRALLAQLEAETSELETSLDYGHARRSFHEAMSDFQTDDYSLDEQLNDSGIDSGMELASIHRTRLEQDGYAVRRSPRSVVPGETSDSDSGSTRGSASRYSSDTAVSSRPSQSKAQRPMSRGAVKAGYPPSYVNAASDATARLENALLPRPATMEQELSHVRRQLQTKTEDYDELFAAKLALQSSSEHAVGRLAALLTRNSELETALESSRLDLMATRDALVEARGARQAPRHATRHEGMLPPGGPESLGEPAGMVSQEARGEDARRAGELDATERTKGFLRMLAAMEVQLSQKEAQVSTLRAKLSQRQSHAPSEGHSHYKDSHLDPDTQREGQPALRAETDSARATLEGQEDRALFGGIDEIVQSFTDFKRDLQDLHEQSTSVVTKWTETGQLASMSDISLLSGTVDLLHSSNLAQNRWVDTQQSCIDKLRANNRRLRQEAREHRVRAKVATVCVACSMKQDKAVEASKQNIQLKTTIRELQGREPRVLTEMLEDTSMQLGQVRDDRDKLQEEVEALRVKASMLEENVLYLEQQCTKLTMELIDQADEDGSNHHSGDGAESDIVDLSEGEDSTEQAEAAVQADTTSREEQEEKSNLEQD